MCTKQTLIYHNRKKLQQDIREIFLRNLSRKEISAIAVRRLSLSVGVADVNDVFVCEFSLSARHCWRGCCMLGHSRGKVFLGVHSLTKGPVFLSC